MRAKAKSFRDSPSLPFNSAIPRSSGAIYLMLNRLATERERLEMEEADLLRRLEQKRARIAKLDAEIETCRNMTDTLKKPAEPVQYRQKQKTAQEKEQEAELYQESVIFEY